MQLTTGKYEHIALGRNKLDKVYIALFSSNKCRALAVLSPVHMQHMITFLQNALKENESASND